MLKIDKDQNIIKLIKINDQTGCKELMDCYGSSIYGILYRMVNNKQIADELLKKSVLKLCNDIKRNQLNMLCLFSNLMQIARNLALNHQVNSDAQIVKKNYLNSIFDLVFNQGLSLVETAKIMNLSLAEVSAKLRCELKQINNQQS